MRKTTLALVLGALILAAPAGAKMAPAPPPALRAATADAVVVGKVTELAAKTEKAEMFKGDTRDMTIATVKVESALLGKPGTTVKVGFFLPTKPAPGGLGRPFRRAAPELTKGQEACLFLTKHPTKKNVYVVQNTSDVIDKNGNAIWKTEVEEVKKAGKLLTSPTKGLKSKDADERLLTAALLILRYKTPTTGNEKTENVPAAESKLILTTLAEADWAAAARGRNQLGGQGLFYMLRATAKDGWEQPKDFSQVNAEAKKWLKDNAGKFKLTRVLREKLSAEVSEEPEG